jgi:hypothetical protein
MLLFCPDCQSAFTGVSRCPRCGGLLLMPEEAPSVTDGSGLAPVAKTHPTAAGRIFVGTVVSLGLYFGLRKLAAGLVRATLDDAEGWWQSAAALLAVFMIQGTAAVFGSILAAAGRARGIALGAAVGGLCGVLFLAGEVAAGAPPDELVLLLQPVLLLVCGAIAGAVGAWIWAPVPELDMPAPLVKKSSSIQLLDDAPRESSRPTVWWRVVVGAAVILIGMGLADKARHVAEKKSGGVLKVESRGQGKFMSWQIATLAVLAGGAIAGAGTGAGVRHGVFTGVLGGIGTAVLGVIRGEFTQPEEYLLKFMNLAAEGPQDPTAFLGIGLGVLVASFVGGWFGGQLFPPLAPKHMRKHRLKSYD